MALYKSGSLFADTLPDVGVTAKDASRYQEYLSNTSHQRAMADLKAAGLNPILAGQNGASTPSGQVDSGDILQVLNGAVQSLGETAKALSDSPFQKFTWATVLKAFGVKSSQAQAIGELLEAWGLTPGVVANWTQAEFDRFMKNKPDGGDSSAKDTDGSEKDGSSPLSDPRLAREIGFTGMMTKNGKREFYVKGFKVTEQRYLNYIKNLERSFPIETVRKSKEKMRYAAAQYK